MPTIEQIQAAWQTLATAVDDARKLAADVTGRVAEIRDSDQWADDYKRELIGQWQSYGADTAAALRRKVDQAAATLLDAAKDSDEPAGGDTRQLLTETRAQRAWGRLRGLLDSGRDWQTLVDESEQRRDRDAVRALLDELPAYLRARAPKPTDGRPDWDERAVAERLDVAAVRVFGDKTEPGRAARLRLHVAARHPLALAVLDVTDGQLVGRVDQLGAAIATHYAERTAARIEGQLTGEPATATA